MILNDEKPEKKTVITASGITATRENTKYIDSKYYIIDKECIELDGEWYSIASGKVIFDHENQIYVHKRNSYNMYYGVVLVDGTLTNGYFSPNPYNNVECQSNQFGNITAINSEILESNGYFEDMATNKWYCRKDLSTSSYEARIAIRNEIDYTRRGYNIEDNTDLDIRKSLYKNYPTKVSPKAKLLAKYIDKITFGMEIEVAKGSLGSNLQMRHGAVPVRDGSLNGGMELATVVLQGSKGLQSIVNLCNDLKDRTKVDLSCSMHLHFGNFGKDKRTVIALYILARKIQNELFEMFPYYKVEPGDTKKKNYTQKLKKLSIGHLLDNSQEAYECYIADSWSKLFDFYSSEKIAPHEYDKKGREHPAGPKWNQYSRYYYFNLMNMFFTHRHTAEARLHSGTTNPHKIINWLMINIAILKYAEKNAMSIITSDEPISLVQVLNIFPSMFPHDKNALLLSEYLSAYITERKEKFKKDLAAGDHISMWDLNDDKDYTFTYKGLTGLI